MTVLEAAVSPAAHQRAHQRQKPTARRRMQSRAARIHLSVHVGAVQQQELHHVQAVVLYGVDEWGAAALDIHCIDVRATLQEQQNSLLAPGVHGHVQGSEPFIIANLQVHGA